MSPRPVILGALAKLRTCLSVRMKTGIFMKFEYFSKIYRENSSFIKIWQEKRVLYMKTNDTYDNTRENQKVKAKYI